MTTKRVTRKASFQIEDGPAYEGYTDGCLWNGWQMPVFEKEEALRFVAAYSANFGYVAQYNPVTDIFSFYDEDGTIMDTFGAIEVFYGDRVLKVYPIGTGCWVWEEAPECDGTCDDDPEPDSRTMQTVQLVEELTLEDNWAKIEELVVFKCGRCEKLTGWLANGEWQETDGICPDCEKLIAECTANSRDVYDRGNYA